MLNIKCFLSLSLSICYNLFVFNGFPEVDVSLSPCYVFLPCMLNLGPRGLFVILLSRIKFVAGPNPNPTGLD